MIFHLWIPLVNSLLLIDWCKDVEGANWNYKRAAKSRFRPVSRRNISMCIYSHSYCQKDDHFPLQAQRFTMPCLLTKTIDSCPDGQMTEYSSYLRISDGCIGQGLFDGIPLRRFCSRVGSPQSPSFFGQIRVHLFWMLFLVTWISNWWKYMEWAHLLNTNSANQYREWL